MTDGLALPRARVRTRRRKPRTRYWWLCVFMLCSCLILLALNVLSSEPLSASGMALCSAYWRRRMRHPLADPEAPHRTLGQERTDLTLALGGFALSVGGAAT
jgi:hypothetical protein